MPKPNLFIVGAPKCGTTALAEYIQSHPNVYMCNPKEPHYFAFDIPNYRVVKNEEEYLRFFENANDNHLVIGEASVFYLYSKCAIQEIKKFCATAMIIVMVRNPVDLVYSLHSQLLYTRDEDQTEFLNAWMLCKQRKNGHHIPVYCRDKKILYYDEIAKTGDQLERLLTVFPRQQVKIVFFEDFVTSTSSIYHEVLDFLKLPKFEYGEFKKINANKKHRVEWLADFTERPPDKLVRLVNLLKSMLHMKHVGILNMLRRLNMNVSLRPALDGQVRSTVIEEYRTDIMKLSLITNRNLKHWLA